jgi:hypothetical protein
MVSYVGEQVSKAFCNINSLTFMFASYLLMIFQWKHTKVEYFSAYVESILMLK